MNRLRTAAWAFCGLASCGGRTLDDIFVAPAASPAVVSVVTDAGAETGPKDASVDADAAPAKVPLPDSATVVDLGLRTTGELVTFPIPAGTLGFQLVVQAPDEDALVRIDRLVSPSGQVLFEEGKPRGTELPTAEGFGWATAAVPQSDVYSKSPVESGVFSAKVFGEVSGRVLRVSLVLQKTKDGFFHGGELDLHVYVPKAWQDSRFAVPFFSAVVYAQCMHYAAVLHVMPQLEGQRRDGPLSGMRPALFFGGLAVLAVLLFAGFTQDFSQARSVYGIAAALHAWVEVPLLLMALAPGAGERPAGSGGVSEVGAY